MMKKCMMFLAAFALAGAAFAQQRAGDARGGLGPEALAEISKGYAGTAADKAIRNALYSTPIMTLSANADHAAMPDTHFSDEVRTSGVTDQQSSGRCWLFTGLNVLRAKLIAKYGLGPFTFSQNYVFFYDQLEKANLFLQGVIDTRALSFDDRQVVFLFQNPVNDGGQFTGISNLVMKYGLVPSEVMPESYCANHTDQMRRLLNAKLREDGLRLREVYDRAGVSGLRHRKAEKADRQAVEEMQTLKISQLKEVYHILALCLGVPPAEFDYSLYDAKGRLLSSRHYTPKSFYREFIGDDLEHNYVMVMNDPVREYGKVYEIDCDRHVYDGHNWCYVNLPMEDIKQMAVASLRDSAALYFSCDVGKFLDRKRGVLDLRNFDYESLLGVRFGMDKKERVLTRESGSSHAMTLTAVDLKDGKPVKWMVENSWGDSGYKGKLILTDEWFDEYMFRLVVEKRYVPASVLRLFKQEPIRLPAWDPMFLPED